MTVYMRQNLFVMTINIVVKGDFEVLEESSIKRNKIFYEVLLFLQNQVIRDQLQ